MNHVINANKEGFYLNRWLLLEPVFILLRWIICFFGEHRNNGTSTFHLWRLGPVAYGLDYANNPTFGHHGVMAFYLEGGIYTWHNRFKHKLPALPMEIVNMEEQE